MYEAGRDPYCYRGSRVLKNKQGLQKQEDLDRFELAMTAQRFAEGLPAGRLDATHYRKIHRHLFQDVYAWAGKYRTVRVAKGQSMFCYPENIEREISVLFASLSGGNGLMSLSSEAFAGKAAAFLAELNAIHPFRDGNGRAQLAFLVLVSNRAGHHLRLDRLRPKAFLRAMVLSFGGGTDALAREIRQMLSTVQRRP